MKNFQFLIVICFTILFISCDSSDDSPNVQVSEDNLVGTWDLTKLDIDGTASIPGAPLDVPITGQGKNINANIILTQQPNNITASGDLIVSVSALSVTEDVPMNLDILVSNGTWSINSNGQLIITDSLGSEVFDIKEFDGTTLRISTEQTFPFPFDGQNIIINAKVDMTLQK